MYSLSTVFYFAAIYPTDAILREITDIKTYISDIKFRRGLALIKQN